ncbi:hypothetical protein [Agathobaculum hominis]
MKKRHAALAALALVGILSGCGHTKTQPETQAADNTVSISPVEKTTTEKQSGAVIEYLFSGNNTEANGIIFNTYTYNGKTWENTDKPIGVYGMGLNNGTGTIILRHDADKISAAYDIEMTFPSGGASLRCGDPSGVSKRPSDSVTVTVAGQERSIDDLAVGVEIPLVVRVFDYKDGETDEGIHTVDINAFTDPDSSEALKNCSFAEAITVKFIHDDSVS